MTIEELDTKLAAIEVNLQTAIEHLQRAHAAGIVLRDKAQKLVDMLDDAEVNHGSLIGGVTMRARDELRQELLKWK